MKIELHILQNFAPANLNRDDTGSPKDCEFGGHRRARISSQCQKRAVRELFRLGEMLPSDNLAARTKRLAVQVGETLVDRHGHERDSAIALAIGAIEGVGLKRASKGEGDDAWKTEYLLFVPRRVIQALADLLHEHRADLSGLVAVAEPEDGKKKSAKKSKSDARKSYPEKVRKEVERLLTGAADCVDLALFGRMIADRPEWNVEASCQVAHAVSTHRVQMDFDFYTAVDDFKPGDTAGSDMMGTIQFNSSCFYRYAVLDVDALSHNLDGNAALASAGARAFAEAFVRAIPSAKQNSMAAHNPPSYVLAVVRPSGQPVSLANAFEKPARASGETGLVEDSIHKLEDYLERMRGWLGDDARSIALADRSVGDRPSIERQVSPTAFFDAIAAACEGTA